MITRRTMAAGLGVTFASLAGRKLQAQTPPEAAPAVWRAMPGRARLASGSDAETEIWGFNGTLAPVLQVRNGAQAALSLENATPLPLSLHFHGVRGPNAMDGVGGLTQPPVAPGESYLYRFTPPDAGTYLIRPCVLGRSAEPAERGLSGLLVVNEANPPPVGEDIALLVDDWLVDNEGRLVPFGDGQGKDGRLGNRLTVGGKPAPHAIAVDTKTALVRLRIANGCNARFLRLRLEGFPAFVAAVDGQPTDSFQPLRATLPFAPGSRYDLFMQVPPEPGVTATVSAAIGDGIPLVTLKTTGASLQRRDAAVLPALKNDKLPAEIKLQGATRKDVVITADPAGGFVINGARGAAEKAPLVRVRRGLPVVLTLANRTAATHAFHLHGHACRLLHALDDGWDPYFLDTITVPDNRTVRIAFIADNPGKWLLASTVLERFDNGLWAWFEVS